MQGRGKIMGHSAHPLLVVFPLGLLSTAVIFDVIYLFSNRSSFALASAYAMAAGIIGGVVAAAFGAIDYRSIPSGTRASRIARVHGTGNAVVLVLFAVSWLLRMSGNDWRPSVIALILSFAGFALAGLTGWLGGELVERLGVGVDDHAGVNASSSLSHAPTRSVASRM